MNIDTLKLGRLTKRSEFLHVRDGLYRAQGALVVQMRKAPESDAMRVGFTATKRVGNAVVRNRCKRRMRALAATLLPTYGMAGYDYVFIARGNTQSRPYERLLDDGSKALLSLREQLSKRAKRPNTQQDPKPAPKSH